MKKLVALCAVALMLLLVAPVVGCKQEEPKPTEPRKVSVEEASRILGVTIPMPTYLPEGYKIQEIYIKENTVSLLISDEKTKADLQWKMKMSMTWYSQGQVGGLKLPGERVMIGESSGVIVDRETDNDLWWLWPQSPSPEEPGQFEMRLLAAKEIPKAEMVKVARSVPQ